MKKKILFATAMAFVFCSWTAQQTNELKKAEWLIGTWENKTKRGNVYETWTKANAAELHGKSYMLNNNDTIVFETIRLIEEQGNLFYIPTVRNQNSNLPVRFTLKESSATQLIFENAEHDFPQVITYTKISSDSLVAQISGTKNGQERKQSFPMKRL